MSEKVHVAVDAMGGDNAPGEIVKGAVDAVKERSDIKVTLVGQENVLAKELAQYDYPKDQIETRNATEMIAMAEPTVAEIRKKKDSSIVVGRHMLKN